VKQSSATLVRVNVETAVDHAMADEPLVELLRGDVTRDDYVEFLIGAHGFDGAVESALWYTRGLSTYIDPRSFARAGLIAQDLLFLGYEPLEITGLPTYPAVPCASPAEALGWLYVIERASRLHLQVRHHLVANLPELAPATAYLRAADLAVGARWNSLAAAMDRVAATFRVSAILDGARAGFRAKAAWHSRRARRVLRGA
jgi:heme oxygenase